MGSPADVVSRARRHELLLSSIAVGVIEIDSEGRVAYANESALRILGATDSDLLGRTPDEAGFDCYRESGARIGAGDCRNFAGLEHDRGIRAAVHCVRAGALDAWLDAQVVAMRSPTGELLGAAVSFVEVSERLQLQAEEVLQAM